MTAPSASWGEDEWDEASDADRRQALAAVLRDRDRLVDEVRALRAELDDQARRGPEQCCDLACNGGACESCPCCTAGWCVTGADGVPLEHDDLSAWLAVAAEHNPVAFGWRTDRAALVARTPQPTAPVIYRCDQSNHPSVPCSRCEVVTPAPLPAVPDEQCPRCEVAALDLPTERER